MKTILLTAVAMLAALATGIATAGTIYRCGSEYTGVACAGGQPLVVADAVTASQRADGREVARREKALAEEMARDRRLQEARLRPALAGSLSGAPPTAAPLHSPAKKHPKKRKKNALPDDERDFIATVPKARKPS